MDKSIKKSVKKIVKLQETEIRRLVAELDPLGIGDGLPEDEYDDLVCSIVSVLNHKGHSQEDKRSLLYNIIHEYGIPLPKNENRALNTINKIMQWRSKTGDS